MRRELLIAFIFVILAVVAFFPLMLISLDTYEGNALEKLESLLLDRQEIIIALGTLFLVLGLSVWAGHLSNKSAEHREKFNRQTQAEIKISEFRQQWINELRDDVSRLISIASEEMDSEELAEYQLLWTRIQLRLNPDEEAHNELVGKLGALTNAIFSGNGHADAQTDIQTQVNILLKAEWERLKKDLKDAQNDGAEFS